MSATFAAVLALHIAAGVVGLAAFWLPAVTRKGGKAHVCVGRIFYRATGLVALTGIAMAVLLLVDPLAARPVEGPLSPERMALAAERTRRFVPFLLYLVLITFAPVYHGVRVLETRHDPERLRTPFHTVLNAAAMLAAAAMLWLAFQWAQPVFAALSPIGLLVGSGQLRFARRPQASHMAWWYEHMAAMIGGGIAFHTAFLVLGASRLTGIQFSGPAGWIPWVVPSLVGIPATIVWVRHYRRKFGDLEPRPRAVARAPRQGWRAGVNDIDRPPVTSSDVPWLPSERPVPPNTASTGVTK